MSPELETALKEEAAPLIAGVPEPLKSSIEYSLFGPGKRIRPRLVQAVSSRLGLSPRLATRAALALEMIHAYTLVHDDLPCMDDDDERRGRPTNHKVYGEATALLAGDSLIGLGIDALLAAETAVPGAAAPSATRILHAVRVLSEAMGARGVISGQALEETLRQSPHPKLLDRVFRLKTGALFEAALLVPAAFAGLFEEKASRKIEALREYGAALGVAFQIADDLEDDRAEAEADPANALHHYTPDEARALAATRLREARARLTQDLGGDLGALFAFADEIERKLGATS